MAQWYEALFENYGNRYELEPYTQGTNGECDFIEKEINFNKSFRILENAKNALKGDGGKFIFTTLNGLFPLFHSVKDFLTAESKGGATTYGENTFDLMTFRDFFEMLVVAQN